MKGKVEKNFLLVNLGGKFLRFKIRELPDGPQEGLLVFEGGTLQQDAEGVRGGFFLGEKKYFLLGDSLDRLKVTTRTYPPVTLPPYRGYVGDSILVRLYEPTLFEISHEDYVAERVTIKGVDYRLLEGGRLFIVEPLTVDSIR